MLYSISVSSRILFGGDCVKCAKKITCHAYLDIPFGYNVIIIVRDQSS